MAEDGEDGGPGVQTVSAASDDVAREDMVESYLPGREDYEEKTVLDINDPARVAVLRNMDQLFPHVEHHQPIIDSWLNHFLRSRPSVQGMSRDEAKDILVAAMGGNPSDDATGAKIMQAFGVDQDD